MSNLNNIVPVVLDNGLLMYVETSPEFEEKKFVIVEEQQLNDVDLVPDEENALRNARAESVFSTESRQTKVAGWEYPWKAKTSSTEEEPFNKYQFASVTQTLEVFGTQIKNSLEKIAPNKAKVEFELEVAVQQGVMVGVLCKASGKSSLKVTLEWTREGSQNSGDE
jgi:hypothetical protein